MQGWFYSANVMVSIWWQLLRYFSPQPSPDIKCSPSQYKWIQNVQYESLHWRKVQRYSKISNIKIIICLCMSKVHQKNSFLHVFTQTLNLKLKTNFLQISKFKIDKSVLFPMMGMLSVLYIAECLSALESNWFIPLALDFELCGILKGGSAIYLNASNNSEIKVSILNVK